MNLICSLMKIKITSGNVEAEGELNSTETAKAILESLPFEGTISTWGDEIYFEIPVSLEAENNANEIVDVGDIAYWPRGKCFCIFFGKTPASVDERPKAASKVNVFGSIVGDYKAFKKIKSGKIRVEAL
jgi:uncharacterized protein